MIKIRVLGSRILVKEEKNDIKTSSGIIVHGRDKEPTYRGTVYSLGDGALLENGSRVPLSVNIGDTVIYTSFSGSPINVDGMEYIILNERDILCVLD